MQKHLYLMMLVIGACFCTSCDNNRVFEQNIDIPEAQWYADSVLHFQFDIENVEANYNIYYNIRNSLLYPYYNMYVTCYLEDEQGKLLASELQDIQLMHSKTGEPFGEGLGDIFSHQLPIERFQNFQFPKPGKYHFRVKQYMRQNPLPEVVSFGLRIENASAE